MKKLIFLPLCLFLVAGCSSLSMWDDEPETKVVIKKAQPPIKPESNSIHFYVTQVAAQLFDTAKHIDTNKSIAVGTILPVTLDSGNKLPDLGSLGLQVQESLMTLSTQAGLKVIEFKTMPMINIGEHRDQMLSRELQQLNTTVNADYYLTGTYTQQQNSVVLNIRLVDIDTKNVLAAATDYIPTNTMWSQSRVMSRNNAIYRSEY